MNKNIRVSVNQSLFDIALQSCGSVEAVFGIAELNGLAITDALAPGQELLVPEPANKPVADYYKMKGLRPATGIETLDELRDEGIDYWAVEVDFVVN
ncbi:MAG: hypothetical protein A2W90_18035 [Bacteroidetes bacterium GWF2_42_66]|nr:MAG: hypothetical protein A2W92_22295 [Bacteroidetes bacterium GWA2_42_15]OFX98152.1 MAG: hypothetical protein A2W89_09525 [Bacteroidetes bacterium GWE2_42_39]OFY42537.1 MAG: hypothetical protein A2W90_18035 [Bacteroidetes bacterium GWF2_42_66]HBL74253.1 hypothetical protein [Prolixibacteraceae bacterium]HCU64022.1 hypothetical protein [Prolixibacteraceae bacterium]